MLKEIITIANQKGGVAKSTTANAIGLSLIGRGYKVLFVDMDAQCNLTYTLGGLPGDTPDSFIPNFSVRELLNGTAKVEVEDVIQHTKLADLIPATPNLSRVESEIDETGKEYRLKEALEPIQNNYDYIIIDTPPALSLLTTNALTTCNSVIIPAQADAFSIQGILGFKNTYDLIKKYCNPNIQIKGILLTRYNGRAVLSKDVADQVERIAETLNTKVFKTVIRESISIKEAQIMQENLFTYAPKSNGALDYNALVDELLEEGNK